VVNKYGTVVQPLSGRGLNFTPSGNGSAAPPATTTDGSGAASTAWTLSTTPGANTLLARTPTSRAIAPVPYEAEATFSATGQPPLTLFWMPTLGSTFVFTGQQTSGLQPTVLISVDGQPQQTLTTTEAIDGYQGAWDLTQLTAGPIYRLTVRLNGDDLGYIDLRVRDGRLRTVEGDRMVLTLDQVTNYRFKFKLLQ
jgi:hypothetical protein